MDTFVVVALAVLTALFLVGTAGLKLLRRRRPAESFAGMRDREFDARVGEAFRLQGYQLVDTGRGGRDGQADLLLRRDRQTYVVLTRQRQADKVSVDALQALHRTMAMYGAAGGFALTAGRFSRAAAAFAGGCNIRLIEGPALREMLGKATVASRRDAAVPR